MGLMPSSVGEHTSLYEPIGSYPQATGLKYCKSISDSIIAAMMKMLLD
jgi:hypothetical protein